MKNSFFKFAAKPKFVSRKRYGEDFIVIHEKPEKIKLDKPICVGCAVLELGTLSMYKFWYDFIKEVDITANLLYMDTIVLLLNLLVKVLTK